jgi:putative membrane-bound dehydrogenase-like protein
MSAVVWAAPPRVADSRYKLELVASEPEIVTPIGVAFDRQGRLLVVESHTHQRPKEYNGPPSDRVRMLADSDGDGKLDKWSTFAEGFRHAMNLMVRDDGAVYLVERGRVLLLRDTNDDGSADKQQELLRLETTDDYPHNALGGIARDSDGSLILSMGENHGAAYRLIGADGTTIKDGGGEDGFYRMTADGKKITRFASGVWNPFSICTLPDGRIFAVDNDPDASPPCRLLHIVPGGDYGYLYQYGRAGTHPLQAWNGELPGTLPMVCGVGEAPTAIVPHAGRLWVTSWGDHRIERYELVPRGASYGAKREIIVQGGADFRPTGMAIAPDGSLYFGDWVLRDYPVHGRGRIWRLVLPEDEAHATIPPRSKEDLAASSNSKIDYADALSDDPFVRNHFVWQLSRRDRGDPLIGVTPGMILGVLRAERLAGSKDRNPLLRAALKDESPDVRLFAVRWIADRRIMALRDDVAKLLEGPQPNPRYYLAVLAAVDWLDHEPSHRKAEFNEELLVGELSNEQRSPEIHALALSLLKPDNKFLTADRLRDYLQSKESGIRLEAVRSLAQQSTSKRFELLAAVAKDGTQQDNVRAEAIVGLSAAADKNRDLLEGLTKSKSPALRLEATRALRLAGLRPAAAESKPPADDIAAWSKLLQQNGDTVAGRRLFFSAVGARCSVCPKYGGRGGNIGPDLTAIGRSASRERIITSVLQPSLEIAPDYQSWILLTSDGKAYTGLRLPKAGDNGQEDYSDAAGDTFTLPSASIEERHVSSKSIMPDNLQSLLSIDDLRDLVTFLTAEKPMP